MEQNGQMRHYPTKTFSAIRSGLLGCSGLTAGLPCHLPLSMETSPNSCLDEGYKTIINEDMQFCLCFPLGPPTTNCNRSLFSKCCLSRGLPAQHSQGLPKHSLLQGFPFLYIHLSLNALVEPDGAILIDHGIIYVEKVLSDHQVQLLPQHSQVSRVPICEILPGMGILHFSGQPAPTATYSTKEFLLISNLNFSTWLKSVILARKRFRLSVTFYVSPSFYAWFPTVPQLFCGSSPGEPAGPVWLCRLHLCLEGEGKQRVRWNKWLLVPSEEIISPKQIKARGGWHVALLAAGVTLVVPPAKSPRRPGCLPQTQLQCAWHHVGDNLPVHGLRGVCPRHWGHHCLHLHGPVEHPGPVQQPGDSRLQLPGPVAHLREGELRLHGMPWLLHHPGAAR